MCNHKLLSLVCGLALCVGAAAQNVDESRPGEAVERHLSDDAPAAPWLHEPKILDSEGGDEDRDYKEYKVKVEARFSVGEYNIAVLSAQESTGLDRYLPTHPVRLL